ncbi:hypothetical protein ACFLTH_15565 [Bacteroidota bacterium]
MATFLDIGLISKISIIFVFLLVFAIIYAVLEYITPFGSDKKGIHAIIGLAIAFIIIISKPAVLMVNFMTPWFLVLFLFIFFIIFAVRMFGTTEATTASIITDRQVYPWLIIIVIVIFIAGLSKVFGQQLLEQGTQINPDDYEDGDVILPGDIEGGSTKTASFGDNVLNTIIHPKVLGLIAIMLIAMFAVIFLTRVVRPPD